MSDQPERPSGGWPSDPPGNRARLNDEDRGTLREIALDCIRQGLKTGRSLDLDRSRYSPSLQEPGACFVTLELGGRLRGCVGSIEARRSLVEGVVLNAFAAAFRDYRFPPLSEEELPKIEFHISRLTPVELMEVENREDLLRSLEPGVDGLLMEDPPHRSTFLPQVWQSLKRPEDFLRELLRKAGLPPDHWSPTISFYRYRVEEF